MSLQNLSENTTFKYLALGVIIVCLLVLVKEVILKSEELEVPEITYSASEVKINFDVLANPEVVKLIPFEKLSMPEDYGRTNPFEDY